MPTLADSFWRDANVVPITEDGLTSRVSKTTDGSNETDVIPLWRITGNIEVRALYGVVTTVLGSNQTAAYWRLNDQTAQVNITLNTGTTVSSAAVGSLLVKKGLAAAALTLSTSAAGRITEPTTLETLYHSPFVIVAKNGANTDIEYVYTTTTEPTSGVIEFFLRWLPLSSDAAVTAQ